MHKYEIIIYWSGIDDAFIAEVPELEGCAADGQNYEDALAMIQEVMDIWIETQKEMGHPIPEPKGRLMFA
ncbi:MAG: type II toxin-antitoxin system HicB family antitoxin [Dehalococcoidia bacterium]|nr:type II toxin-antitoxin system HicB family antitoxin [Dehalococcoidia bacterium]